MSAIKDFFFGRGDRFEQIPTVTGGQQNILDQILGGLSGGGFGEGPLGAGLQNLMQLLSGSPEALEAFQAPALRQFEEQIVPSIAERFSGLGAQRSSAFPQALSQAGASLAEQLSAQRAGLQSGALSQLQSLLGLGLQPQFQLASIPGQEGLFQKFAGGLGEILGGLGKKALGAGLLGAITPGVRGFKGGLRQVFGD